MARRDDTLEVVFIDVEARTKDLDAALQKITADARSKAREAGQAIAASLTPALNGAAAAAKEAATAQAPFERQIAELAKGVVNLEASFKNGTITQAQYNRELRRLRDETTALVNAQSGFGTNSREAAAALKVTDGIVKELAVSVRNTRSAFIAGRIGAEEYRSTSERLKGEIDELFRSTNLTTDQQLKLNIASATAERGLASLRGESSRLGLAWNVQVGLSNQLGQSLRGLGPIGGAAAGSLGLMSKALDGLSRPLDTSKLSFDGFLQSAVRAPRVLATATAALTVLAIAGMARFAQQAARVADELDKSARSVGLAVEEYQELQFALGQSGVKADSVRTALGNLNTRIGEAINGNELYRETLTGLGVDLAALRDGTSGVGDALSQIADGIAGIQSPAEQARIAAQLFGRSLGNQLLPALKDGATGLQALRDQARELGLVISGDAVVSLVEYADTVEILRRQFQTAGVEISAAFIPILRDFLIPLIQNTVVPWVQNAARAVSGFARTFVDAGEEGQVLRARLVEMLSPILRIADSIIGAGKGFLAFSNFALGSVAAVGAIIGDLSVQIGSLAGQFLTLTEGLRWYQQGNLLGAIEVLRRASNIEARIDFAQTGQAAIDAAAPFFERANRFSLEAGENFGRAFVTGYEAIIEDLYIAARDAVQRGSGNLFDIGEDAGGTLGAGTAAGFERAFEEGSLGALRQALARANEAFEAAADEAGRAAANALKNQIQAAITDIESRFRIFTPDPAAAAREWTRRLLAEVEYGLKDYGTVFDLLAPRAEELRAEAGVALRDFGIDSSEYQDTVAKLSVVEDALKRLAAFKPITIEVDTQPFRDFVREYEATQRALRDIAEAERIRRDTERALLFASASPSTQGPPGRNLVAEVTATAIALKELEDAAGIARDTFLQQLAVNAVPSTQGPPGRDLEVEAESTAGALRDLAAAAAIARDTMIAQRLAEAGPTVQGPPGRDLELEARETAAAIQQIAADSVAAQDILLDTARSLVASGASALELRAALEALSRAGVELPRDLEEVALALLSVSDAAGRVGRGVGAPPAPAGPRLIIDPFGDLPQRGRELAEAGKEAGGKIAEMAEQARLAGVDFRQAIVIAGAQFTASLIQDIQSGNIAGAFRSAFGVAGQVAGAGASFLQSGGLSFLGLGASAIPGLQLVAGLLPVFGSIVSGMLGQQARSASDVERARGVTPRGASSISLSFNFYQSLALASLTDPESRAALRGSALEAFEQFRRLLEVNVLPRLDRLEARA